MAGQTIIKHIREQVHSKNRNFTAACVGKVGTGKSYSVMHLAEILDPNFSVDNVVFRITDLLDLVNSDKLQAGSVVVFDEAGIDASNRQSYMNKLNKALSFLLQTWRFRRIILFVTIPDISMIDAGTRKMFDAVFETMAIIKRERVCVLKIKFIQVNAQSGKAYFKRPRNNSGIVKTKLKKPNIKLVNRYEKKKAIFLDALYREIKQTLEPPKEITPRIAKPRCPECGSGDIRYIIKEDKQGCRVCGNKFKFRGRKSE